MLIAKNRSKKKLIIIAVAVAAIMVLTSILWVFVLPNRGEGATTVAQVVETTSFVSAGSKVIGLAGGDLSIDSESNPLHGFKLEVPSTVAHEDINFEIAYADITSVSGLPKGAVVASKMIQIEASGSDQWNEYKVFGGVINVTLPYDSSIVTDDMCVRFYQYDGVNHSLESAGFTGLNAENHTVSFEASTFCEFFGIGVPEADLMTDVDSGFRPAINGWFIPNYGSYQTSAGNCLGMCAYASWFYSVSNRLGAGNLYSKYIEDKPNDWRDDATAIQLATRAQLAMADIEASSTQYINSLKRLPETETGYSILHGLLISGKPQLVGLNHRSILGSISDEGHAVLAYRYADGHFNIYDPNVPGTDIGNRQQQMPFTMSGGFTEDFQSGSYRYNNFCFLGRALFIPNNVFKGLYDAAELKFEDDSKFPTVILTDSSTSPLGTTPADTDGDGVRDTTENRATISGKISGGDPTKKMVSTTLAFINGKKYKTSVATDGTFSLDIPLNHGNNSVAILATDLEFHNWAGYLRDTINSSTSRPLFTITLTWDQGNSDVDLHVMEPTINGTEGRHIYYLYQGDGSGGPYLDIDNVIGYGPEHYYANEDMVLPQTGNIGPNQPLYGTYQIRVHYYGNPYYDSSIQPISWHLEIKYLVAMDPRTGQEAWEKQTIDGYLSFSDPTSASDFYSGGASWSQLITFTFSEPLDPNALPES